MDRDLQFLRQVTNHRSTSSVGTHCSGYSVWPGTGTPYGGAAGRSRGFPFRTAFLQFNW